MYLLLPVMFASNSLPKFEDFKIGRRNFDVYRIFCERFVHCVIGTGIFKNACYKSNLMDYCSVSDEAITFLILENNWEIWTAMGEAAKINQLMPLKECGITQKYFGDKIGRGHSWNSEGKEAYNNYFDNIVIDRSKYGIEFDSYFLETLQDESAEGMRFCNEKRRKLQKQKVVIQCRNDYVPKANRTRAVLGQYMDESGNVVDTAINRTNV